MKLVVFRVQKVDFQPEDKGPAVVGTKILAIDLMNKSANLEVKGHDFLQVFVRGLEVFHRVDAAQIPGTFDAVFEDQLNGRGKPVRTLTDLHYVGPVGASSAEKVAVK